MPYDPHRHHRRSIRLRGYDYTCPGAYFITVVTWGRECLFGEILDGEMQMNELGAVAQSCWQEIPAHFPNVQLDAYVVMPNHIHGIRDYGCRGDACVAPTTTRDACVAPTIRGVCVAANAAAGTPTEIGWGNGRVFQIRCRKTD